MKVIFFSLLLTSLLMSTPIYSQTEQQAYQVIRVYPDFEIRYYPPAVLAKTYSHARSYREISSSGFNTLAGYIFGGNQQNQKIAMTAPVHMDISPGGSSMAFVMPAQYRFQDLPQPLNAAVKLEIAPAEYIAAIQFSGYANDRLIATHVDELSRVLALNGIQSKGNYRFLGYNSPYRVWNRRNEIIVGVIWE